MRQFKNSNLSRKSVTSHSLEALTRLVPRHPLPQAGEGEKNRATRVKNPNSLLLMLGEGLGMRVEA
jgi:hypothetical protein